MRSGCGARGGRPACRSSPTSTASPGRSSRPSTWSGASACSPAGRASTCPARPVTSTPITRPRARRRSRRSADYDIVCVHVEAPDEASHEGRPDAKVEAIERIDRDIVGPVRRALEAYDRWRMVISPDHSTLLRTRAHDRAPVAWAMAGTGLPASGRTYDEFSARERRLSLLRPGLPADGPFPRSGLGRSQRVAGG